MRLNRWTRVQDPETRLALKEIVDSLTTPNVSAFRAFQSVAQAHPGGEAPISFDMVKSDMAGEFDPLAGLFTASTPGRRLITAGVTPGVSQGDNSFVSLKAQVTQSGVVSAHYLYFSYTGGAGFPLVAGADWFDLLAGDSIAILARFPTAGNLATGEVNTWFSAAMLP